MRLHPRFEPVQKAKLDVARAVMDVVNSFRLSNLEILGILLEEAKGWQTYALRHERHPEDPSRKADEA